MIRRQISEEEIRKAAGGRPFVSASELVSIESVSPYAASLTIRRASWLTVGNRKLSLIPCAHTELNYIQKFNGPFNTLPGAKSVMTKSTIKAELLRWNEDRPFMSITDVSKALGCGADNARKMLQGLSYLKLGKRKAFLIDDIAAAFADRKQQ